MAYTLARQAVSADKTSAHIVDDSSAGRAQNAIAIWLVKRARIDPDRMLFGPPGSDYIRESLAAADRFARLSPAEQRRWLEEHYADLRAGKVTLEDLP